MIYLIWSPTGQFVTRFPGYHPGLRNAISFDTKVEAKKWVKNSVRFDREDRDSIVFMRRLV